MSSISIDDAVECVRFTKYGEECVGPPTKREEYLNEKYGERPALTYMSMEGGNLRWAAYHRDLDLAKEIASALDQHSWREKQYEDAEKWLVYQGFDLDAESFSIAELARALKREFPDAYLRFARAGGLLPLDRRFDEQRALKFFAKASPAKLLAVVEPVAANGRQVDHPIDQQATLIAAPDASQATQLPTVEQEAAIPAPDAARAKSTEQALVEKEIWKEYPEGVPADTPPRRVRARVIKSLPAEIKTWTINRAVKNCRRPA